MAKVILAMTMSLDGFITGPNDSVEKPLGEGGERLHEWVYDLGSWRERHGLAGGQTNRDAEVMEGSFKNVGAVVMGRQIHLVPVLFGDGRRLFDHLGTEQMELETARLIESPGVTHVRFRVVR